MSPVINKGRIAVIGATGRLGGILQYQARKNGLTERFIWQSRRSETEFSGCSIVWNPESGANPAERLANAIVTVTKGQPVTLLNLAGTTPSATKSCSKSMEASNAWLAAEIMKAAKLINSPRIMFASSAAVYGPMSNDQPAFFETAKPAPANIYGEIKSRMERWVISNTPDGINTCLLRIGNVAGADALLGQFTNGTMIPPAQLVIDRFASGSGPIRSYIGPETLFNVLLCLADNTSPLMPVINIASQPAVAMDALLDAWQKQRPSDFKYKFRPAPTQAIERVVLDTGHLQKFAGQHLCSADDIVAETIRHYFERSAT